MKSHIPIAVLFSLCSPAFAASVVQTQVFGFTPNGSQTQTFQKFDGSLGTLESVTIRIVMDKTGGSFQVDNDSAQSGTLTLDHNLQGAFSASGVSVLDSNFEAIGALGNLTATTSMTAPIGATTGDNTTTFDATGSTDFISFNPADASVSDSGTINNLFLSQYIGTGTFTTQMSVTQLVNATGLGGLQQAFTVSNVTGLVEITYNYLAIPEPASAALLGFSALALLRRRRA